MNKIKSTFLVILVGIVIVVGYVWVTYNGLIVQNENIEGQWAQVENQYQRRFDLIPNLVDAVKGSLKQEQAVFGAIAEARARYGGAKTTNDKATAAGGVESALSRLLVVIENYPQLRSLNNITELMIELEGTENRLGVERMRYNDLVRVYNKRVKGLPVRLFADKLGFKERAYFENVAGAEIAPAVTL